MEAEQAMIDINWDFGESMSVEFLTAYTDQYNKLANDWDGSQYDIVYDLNQQDNELWSQEIQFTGGRGRVSWLGGAYYWEQDTTTRDTRNVVGEFFSGQYDINNVLNSPICTGPVPAGIPMDVLNRRPDMVAAERRVAAAFDRVGEARASMLPTLSLSAGYGRISNEAVQMRDDLEQTTASTAATTVIPLYTGGALTAQVAVRTAEQKAAVADYARRALLALGEVEDALNADRVLGERERILGDAAAASRDATRLEQDAYRVGKSDLRAVNQRQLAQWSAEVALLHVRRERLARRVDLHLALGGNFGEPPATEAVSAAAPDSTLAPNP